MLSRQDNEIITRVGPGTPMGALLREYWIPVVLSSEIPLPDCKPVRVRLLGEDLVCFRNTSGTPGLLGQFCPHRSVSLAYGRNEFDGLRCSYHGWKFDLEGRCVDMPNEPSESNFKDKIRHTAYRCVERNGVVWTYMGGRAEAPPLPMLEWNLHPENVPILWRNYRHCNWVQSLEGDLDSAHVNFLHATVDPRETLAGGGTVAGRVAPGGVNDNSASAHDRAPRLEVVETGYGVMYSARRKYDDAREYHRIHPFLFPFHTLISGEVGENAAYTCHVWVPMDDENTLVLEADYRPGKPWSDAERADMERVRNPHGYAVDHGPGGAWKVAASSSNDYGFDYELQRTRLFLGMVSNVVQDTAMQESMGPICPRWNEHLGSTDAMIIQVRKRLIHAARALADSGSIPPGVDDPQSYAVRPTGLLLPKGANWVAASKDFLRASSEAAP